MLDSTADESPEPPDAHEDEEEDDELLNLMTNIRIADGNNFDLKNIHQYRHYPIPRGVVIIVKNGDHRDGWDILMGTSRRQTIIGWIYVACKTAKLYCPNGIINQSQHKMLRTILENAGYSVCVLSNGS